MMARCVMNGSREQSPISLNSRIQIRPERFNGTGGVNAQQHEKSFASA